MEPLGDGPRERTGHLEAFSDGRLERRLLQELESDSPSALVQEVTY